MALSSALPNPPANAADLPAPIAYHPLDLSHPELHRVLGEMNEAYGSELDGKVSSIGLHGDYEAGLQLIRDGKLHEIRDRSYTSTDHEDVFSVSSASPPQMAAAIGDVNDKDVPPASSPPLSATSNAEIIRPEDLTSPQPSAITDVSSVTSKDGDTWSPIDSEQQRVDHDGQSSPPERPLHYLFLGSSLGNFDRASAAPFLKSLPLKPGDTLLLGLDGRPPPGPEGKKKVEMAYNDPAGHTRAFEEHGWDVVKKELGIDQGPGVEFVGRYNEELGRHEAYFRSLGTQTIRLSESRDVTLDEGELLNIEWSFKVGLRAPLWGRSILRRLPFDASFVYAPPGSPFLLTCLLIVLAPGSIGALRSSRLDCRQQLESTKLGLPPLAARTTACAICSTRPHDSRLQDCAVQRCAEMGRMAGTLAALGSVSSFAPGTMA